MQYQWPGTRPMAKSRAWANTCRCISMGIYVALTLYLQKEYIQYAQYFYRVPRIFFEKLKIVREKVVSYYVAFTVRAINMDNCAWRNL